MTLSTDRLAAIRDNAETYGDTPPAVVVAQMARELIALRQLVGAAGFVNNEMALLLQRITNDSQRIPQ